MRPSQNSCIYTKIKLHTEKLNQINRISEGYWLHWILFSLLW